MTRSALATVIDTIRVEGAAAAFDRFADRCRERLAARRGRDDTGTWPRVPVLNVVGVELTARGGGVPMQCVARLRHEARTRPVALLSRTRDGFALACWAHGQVRRRTLHAGGWSGDPLADDDGWRHAVTTAMDLVGASTVHVENAHGLSLRALLRVSGEGRGLVLSLHDFAVFCRRPHLVDTSGQFCRYETDPAQCARCLATAAHTIDQPAHRSLGTALLRRAQVVVCPSTFLKEQLSELLAWDARNAVVLAPGLDTSGSPRSVRSAHEIALLGGGADHKGGARWASLAQALIDDGLRVTLYGGDGHHHLRRLRTVRGLYVRGYYRAGTLPSLLARQKASVAVMLPLVPESFSLALSEAWAAGVPVVAPSMGACGERLRDGGGRLLSPDPGDAEIVEAVHALRVQKLANVPVPPTAADAAASHLALYRRLGIVRER
jgi:glycosyltransferase involved in cell wall biosynthesis